jgi:acyl-CoA thioester hydrolase
MNGPKRISTEIDVRFRDVDAMGHVNNAVFFTYFEEGRKVFLEEVLWIVDAADYPFIMAHIQCDFLRPLLLGTRPLLEIWISDIGTKKFTFQYEIKEQGREQTLYCRGESVMVFFDYTARKTIPIPEKILNKIREYVE